MKILHKENKFIAEALYSEKDQLKAAGFWWNSVEKYWWTSDTGKAKKLWEFFTDEAKAELEKKEKVDNASIAASHAVSVDIDIPSPDNLKYLPFQKAGISYAIEKQAVLIADEMGLGKTIEAIGIINSQKEKLRRIMVICPASLRLNWQRELEKWLVVKYTIEITKDVFPASEIVIINYDILKKYTEEIHKISWDLLICDEAHFCKNHSANRTKEVLGGKGIKGIEANKKIFLTGTPILSRPIELWPLAHALSPSTFNSWYDYVKKYCAGVQTRYGWDVKGASNLDELGDKLRAEFMIRRLKKDVLTELPPKRRQIIEIEANGNSDCIAEEKKAYKEITAKKREFKKVVENAKNRGIEDELYKEAVKKLQLYKLTAFTELAKLRHKTALAKVPAVISMLKDMFEEEDKIVCFAHHKDVIESIAGAFKNECVILTGDTSMEDRQKAVDMFQNDSKISLFIGSIMAAGTGITLTAASHVIFTELDWVPGNITQAEDRCHRIGQSESVLIQHVVLDGSLDAKMAKILINKQEVIDKAMGDKELLNTELDLED